MVRIVRVKTMKLKMLIAEVIKKTRTRTRAMMTKMIMMMKTAMLRMFTSEVVAPGGKEGEL